MTSLHLVYKLKRFVAQDSKFLFTLTSYILIIVTHLNSTLTRFFPLGVLAFAPYFMINGIFLAHAFFMKEEAFFRFVLGILLLITLLGFVGWLAMLIYNLDTLLFTLTLLITTTISSMLNRRVKKHEDVTH